MAKAQRLNGAPMARLGILGERDAALAGLTAAVEGELRRAAEQGLDAPGIVLSPSGERYHAVRRPNGRIKRLGKVKPFTFAESPTPVEHD